MTAPERGHGSDRGVTLVELVVVVLILGVVTAAVANSIIVVLRSQQPVSEGLDESRDLLHLATWLPQDASSTPVGTSPGTGIEAGNLPSGCATPDVGVGLVRLTWTEQTGNLPTATYRVSYRAVTADGSTVVMRVSCENFGTATVSTASRRLPLLPGDSRPVSATVSADGSHVVFSITQRDGTSRGRTMTVEASARVTRWAGATP